MGDRPIRLHQPLPRWAGRDPRLPASRAYCDMIHEAAQEIAKINPIVNVFRGEKFEQEKADFFDNVLPSRLKALHILLSDKSFFCGDVVTYSDFAVYHQFDLCRLVVPEVFDRFPNIKSWMARVEEQPGVKDYLAKRPVPVDIGVAPRLQPKA